MDIIIIIIIFWCSRQCQSACVLSHFSRVQLYATLWTVARQAPLSKALSRQDYWSGLLCPPPGNLPNQGLNPRLLCVPALAGRFFTASATWAALVSEYLLWIGLAISHQTNSIGKESACNAGDLGSIPGEGNGMAIHSSILAWRIPWTEEPGRLQSMGLQRAGHDWSDLARTHTLFLKWVIALSC